MILPIIAYYFHLRANGKRIDDWLVAIQYEKWRVRRERFEDAILKALPEIKALYKEWLETKPTAEISND